MVHRAVPIVAMAATKPGTQGCTQSLRLLPSLVPIRLRLPPSLVPMAATKPTTTWYPVSTVGTKPTAARAYQAYSHRYPVCAYGCHQAYGHRSGWLYPVCAYGCHQAYGHRSTATDTYQRSMAHLPRPVPGTWYTSPHAQYFAMAHTNGPWHMRTIICSSSTLVLEATYAA